MDDSFGMRSVQRIRNLDGERQYRLGFHRSAADAVLQRHAIQKFHGDEGLSVLVINFVYGADVRVIQCRSRLGFALKAGECVRVFGYVVGEELKSNKATEFDILSLIDDAHPTTTEFLDDAVVRDGLADHGKRRTQGA